MQFVFVQLTSMGLYCIALYCIARRFQLINQAVVDKNDEYLTNLTNKLTDLRSQNQLLLQKIDHKYHDIHNADQALKNKLMLEYDAKLAAIDKQLFIQYKAMQTQLLASMHIKHEQLLKVVATEFSQYRISLQ